MGKRLSAYVSHRKGYSKLVNSTNMRLYVVTTWFELSLCPSVYLLRSKKIARTKIPRELEGG